MLFLWPDGCAMAVLWLYYGCALAVLGPPHASSEIINFSHKIPLKLTLFWRLPGSGKFGEFWNVLGGVIFVCGAMQRVIGVILLTVVNRLPHSKGKHVMKEIQGRNVCRRSIIAGGV